MNQIIICIFCELLQQCLSATGKITEQMTVLVGHSVHGFKKFVCVCPCVCVYVCVCERERNTHSNGFQQLLRRCCSVHTSTAQVFKFSFEILKTETNTLLRPVMFEQKKRTRSLFAHSADRCP